VGPKTEYWILGVLTALVLGGSQAASRSLQGIFTPDANSAEFFAFYGVSGKFASIFGPMTYGILIAIREAYSRVFSLSSSSLSPGWPSSGRSMRKKERRSDRGLLCKPVLT